jgi:hypothetical protein
MHVTKLPIENGHESDIVVEGLLVGQGEELFAGQDRQQHEDQVDRGEDEGADHPEERAAVAEQPGVDFMKPFRPKTTYNLILRHLCL